MKLLALIRRPQTALIAVVLGSYFAIPHRCAAQFGTNLLANPDAEAGPAGTGGLLTSPPGWISNGDLNVVSYTAGGGFPLLTDPGPANRGNAFFSGFNNTVATGTQSVDLGHLASGIDSGGVACELSGYLGGFSSQNDNARLQVNFLNASSNTLGTLTIGPVLAGDRNSLTGLLSRQNSTVIPAGTRTLLVLLTLTRAEGTYNDGYADELAVVLRATRPALQITSLGNQVRIAWSTNFTGFQLETKVDLASPAPWTNLPAAPSVLGADFTLQTTSSEAQRYFRLRQ